MTEVKAGRERPVRERHVRRPKRPAAFFAVMGLTALVLALGVAWMLLRG